MLLLLFSLSSLLSHCVSLPMFLQRSHARGNVTYRHLHSAKAMTAFNPLRAVVLVDVDCAYAQFEQVRLGLPDDVPLVCAQWESLIAVNYPARKYGIKRMTTINEAKKMCPHLVVQHVPTYRSEDTEAGYWPEIDRRTHKASLDPYRRESLKILAVFREMAPKAELEKASIDEAFLDLTLSAIDRLLERHPYLQTVPDDAPDGMDSPLPPPPPIDWGGSGYLVFAGVEGEAAEDYAPTWADWTLCMAAEITAEVRKEVFDRLHYTTSAGIAHNKPLAKICAGHRKPNQQTILRSSAVAPFLRDMDFTDIRYLGGKLGQAIAEEFKAKTVGDLLTISLEEMQAKFGEESIWVYNIIRGIDHTEVKEKLATKSMGASKNTIPNVTTAAQGHHWLSVLSGELCVRLKEARETNPGLWPKTLVLGTRTNGTFKSRQLPFPFSRDLTPAFITQHARALWDPHTAGIKPGAMKFNNISLSFNGLEKLETGQQGIEGFLQGAAVKKQRTEGGSSVVRASSTDTTERASVKRKTGLEEFLARSETPATKRPKDTLETEVQNPEDSAWHCPRCDFDDEANRAEHEDFHFAQDLQAQYGDVELNGGAVSRGGGSSGREGSTTQPARKGSRHPPKNTGIKAFFAPKR